MTKRTHRIHLSMERKESVPNFHLLKHQWYKQVLRGVGQISNDQGIKTCSILLSRHIDRNRNNFMTQLG
jgi:hypothetical protein